MIDLEKLSKRMQEETEIKCPYCGVLQMNDDGQYPVTYWAEDLEEMNCDECGKEFIVREHVRRTYKIYKDTEEYDNRY